MMATKVLDFQRPSLTNLLAELAEDGPKAEGVIAIWLDEGGHFRISGFAGKQAVFTVCGLLDWIKADLLSDIAGE